VILRASDTPRGVSECENAFTSNQSGAEHMRKLLLATTAALGLAVSAGAANATLTYTIWNGPTVLDHNAEFPTPTVDLLLPSFTDTHDTLNFNDSAPFGTVPTFAAFDATSGGILAAHLTPAQLALPMSTLDTGSDVSTFIRITGSYALAAPFSTTINHDDGGTVWIDGNFSTGGGTTFICGQAAEAALNMETCTLPAGTHTFAVLYTEDNTSPAVLQIALPSEVVPAPLIGRGLPVLLAVGGLLFGAKLLERSKMRRSLGAAAPAA
jgi:hypothetical protein